MQAHHVSAVAWSVWAIDGLEVPMPAPVPPVRTERPGCWLADQVIADLSDQVATLVAIAARWDGWCAEHGLQILEARGPSKTLPFITRTIAGDDVAMWLGLMGVRGKAWVVQVTVERDSAQPRVVIRDGCIHSHGLAIPVMPRAVPGAFIDGAEFDIEDSFTVEVPGATPTALMAFYQPWAASAGLRVVSPVDLDRPYLTFRRRQVAVSITLERPASVVIYVGKAVAQ